MLKNLFILITLSCLSLNAQEESLWGQIKADAKESWKEVKKAPKEVKNSKSVETIKKAPKTIWESTKEFGKEIGKESKKAYKKVVD
jgi:hypothetical protein